MPLVNTFKVVLENTCNNTLYIPCNNTNNGQCNWVYSKMLNNIKLYDISYLNSF